MGSPILGFTPKSAVPIDLDTLIASRLLIQANSGGGKSRAIRYLLEQTFDRVQHLVLDREGEFATLRDKYPYLLVGRDGDVAADLRTAKLLARKVMELGVSVVIDLSEMTLAQQREYVAAFIGALNHLPRPLWHDCLVVIDEAHLFAPEAGKGSSVATEAIAMLLSTGRKRGYCGVLATQRLAKLSKDVSAECLNKLIGRTSQEDLRRAADELGQRSADARELRALEPGHFWAYGPAIATEPVLALTGKVDTSPPARGAARAATAPAPSAIRTALAQLAELPKQAADEAQSIEGLTRENAELKRRVAQLEKGGATRIVETPVIDQAAIDRAVSSAKSSIARDLRKMIATADEVIGRSNVMRQGLAIVVDEITTVPKPAPPVVVRATPRGVATSAAIMTETADGVTGPQQRILNTLASLATLGVTAPSKSNVAVFSNASPTSSAFANNLGRLRSVGLIDYPTGGCVTLTDAGSRVARMDHEIRSRRELLAAWESKLTGPQGAILRVLCEVYPDSVPREDLADAVGASATSSAYANNLGSLRSLGVIDYGPGKTVFATSLLFPEGLT